MGLLPPSFYLAGCTHTNRRRGCRTLRLTPARIICRSRVATISALVARYVATPGSFSATLLLPSADLSSSHDVRLRYSFFSHNITPRSLAAVASTYRGCALSPRYDWRLRALTVTFASCLCRLRGSLGCAWTVVGARAWIHWHIFHMAYSSGSSRFSLVDIDCAHAFAVILTRLPARSGLTPVLLLLLRTCANAPYRCASVVNRSSVSPSFRLLPFTACSRTLAARVILGFARLLAAADFLPDQDVAPLWFCVQRFALLNRCRIRSSVGLPDYTATLYVSSSAACRLPATCDMTTVTPPAACRPA